MSTAMRTRSHIRIGAARRWRKISESSAQARFKLIRTIEHSHFMNVARADIDPRGDGPGQFRARAPRTKRSPLHVWIDEERRRCRSGLRPEAEGTVAGIPGVGMDLQAWNFGHQDHARFFELVRRPVGIVDARVGVSPDAGALLLRS